MTIIGYWSNYQDFWISRSCLAIINLDKWSSTVVIIINQDKIKDARSLHFHSHTPILKTKSKVFVNIFLKIGSGLVGHKLNENHKHLLEDQIYLNGSSDIGKIWKFISQTNQPNSNNFRYVGFILLSKFILTTIFLSVTNFKKITYTDFKILDYLRQIHSYVSIFLR